MHHNNPVQQKRQKLIARETRMPVTVGVNLIETTQFAPAARLKPKLLVCVKAPEIVMPEIVSVALPVCASALGRRSARSGVPVGPDYSGSKKEMPE